LETLPALSRGETGIIQIVHISAETKRVNEQALELENMFSRMPQIPDSIKDAAEQEKDKANHKQC
jgi:hypothetical protein